VKALSLFLPYVAPYVFDCSDPMAEQAVLSACIEFCQRTNFVQNTSSETTVVGTTDYDVEEPSQQELAKVLAVFYQGNKLKARSSEMVSYAPALRNEAIGEAEIATGTPTEWFNRDPAQPIVTVYPAPDAVLAGGITIRAALKPKRTATSVADTLFDDWAEDIASGAVARLMLTPRMPFTNAALAPVFRAQFNTACVKAAVMARVGAAAAASRVQPVPFA
jgi:hypothetical protein